MSGQGLVLGSVGGGKSDGGRCVVEEATVQEANDAVKKTADLAGEDLKESPSRTLTASELHLVVVSRGECWRATRFA